MNRKSRCCLGFVFLSMVACISAVAEEIQPPHPCELYTRADAEVLFQQQVSEGVRKTTVAPAGQSCRYSFQKRGGTFDLTVRTATTASIREEGIFSSAQDVVLRQKRARTSGEQAAKQFMVVADLGDDAFWSGSSLWVLKGDLLAVIKVNPVVDGLFKNRDAMDAAKSERSLALSRQVAKVVLSHLN